MTHKMPQSQPVFSLITCTKDRTQELETLLQSIAEQEFSALELILVDQNEDNRLEPIVEQWRSRLSLIWLRNEPGLSRSRNVGLRHATGKLVAFPDDDCWYPSGLLREIAQWFEMHPAYIVLTVGAVDEHGVPSGNRWIRSECDIAAVNAFRTTFSSTIFLRRTEDTIAARFNEDLGVGSRTPAACGEETDFVLRVLGRENRGFFTRRWHIGHPKRDMLSGQVQAHRAVTYGHGMGYVLRQHKLYGIWSAFLIYDCMRAATCYLRGNRPAAELCFQHALGLLRGGTVPLQSGTNG